MSQSTIIAAGLLAGFVIFLAARGRLSPYLAVLWGDVQSEQKLTASGGSQAPASSGASSGGSTGATAQSAGKTVASAAGSAVGSALGQAAATLLLA